MKKDIEEKIISELNKISDVTLFDDLSKVDFSDLEKKIAEVNSCHSRATKLANKALLILQRRKTQYKTVESIFRIRRSDVILSNDVQQGKNNVERDALADQKMKEELSNLNAYKIRLVEAENLVDVTNNTLKDIEVRKQGLNTQIRLFQQQKQIEL